MHSGCISLTMSASIYLLPAVSVSLHGVYYCIRSLRLWPEHGRCQRGGPREGYSMGTHRPDLCHLRHGHSEGVARSLSTAYCHWVCDQGGYMDSNGHPDGGICLYVFCPLASGECRFEFETSPPPITSFQGLDTS